MKRLLRTRLFAVLLFIISLSPIKLNAEKPAYCWRAFLNCCLVCNIIYGQGTTLASFCIAGCLIGYAGCGDQTN